MSPSTPFRLDQLFNYGGSVEYQDGELDAARFTRHAGPAAPPALTPSWPSSRPLTPTPASPTPTTSAG